MKVWYLSFADSESGRGFLGACIVEAETVEDAASEAHRLGCNPGGQVLGLPAPYEEAAKRVPPSEWGKLLSKEDLERLFGADDLTTAGELGLDRGDCKCGTCDREVDDPNFILPLSREEAE